MPKPLLRERKSCTPLPNGYFVGSATASPVKLVAVGDSWQGDTFDFIKSSFKMNSAGQVAFWASLTIGDDGIFIASPGSPPEAVVITNDESTVPGTVIELEYPDAYLDINSSGQVAFWGVCWIDPSTETYGTGYFIGSAGTTPKPVVTTGQALPGGGTCPLFVPVANGLALADSGELAMYIPGINGAPNLPRYIIADKNGTLRRFASVGDQAPGTDSEFGRLGSVGANSAGKFFVNATLVEGSAKQGLFQSGSMLAPNDIDRDGMTDITVFRPASGFWYSLPSHTPGTYGSTQWGISSDTVVHGDYDGDGKDDIAVWRTGTSTWYIRPSSVPGTYTETQWGVSGDIAVPGDYDADGRTDIAVWRPGNGIWYILPSGSLGSFTSIQWGQASDKPVPADYDGDGKADVAVWRPGVAMWYIRPSGTPGSFIGTQWGISTDLPAGGDFDGDGKADVAVFKPSAGIWYVLPSAAPGTYTAVQWGQTADIPISGLTGILRQAP